jgi:hypothetical protein
MERERGDEIPYGAPMKRYIIQVLGCDDRTVIEMDLDDAQAAFVGEICKQVTAASTYGCMPTMEIMDAKRMCKHRRAADDCWQCDLDAAGGCKHVDSLGGS